MTATARITQGDIVRTLKSLKAAGLTSARVLIDFNAGTIEISLEADSTGGISAQTKANEWADLE